MIQYYVPSEYSLNKKPQILTVTKVGVDYIYAKSEYSRFKFVIKTGNEECKYGSAGHAYISKDYYKTLHICKQMKKDIKEKINHCDNYLLLKQIDELLSNGASIKDVVEIL